MKTKNPCFEVRLNGKLICKAGLKSKHGVLTSILTWVRYRPEFGKGEALELSVSGLDSEKDNHLQWARKNIRKGDTISITVTGNTKLTPHSLSPNIPKKKMLEMKIKSYEMLKKELKGHLKNRKKKGGR